MPIESMKINKNPYLTDPQMTFEEVAKRIKAMGFNEDLTSKLMKKARSMPPGSLGYFAKNIQTFIANLTQGGSKKSPPPEIKIPEIIQVISPGDPPTIIQLIPPEVNDGNTIEQT